MAEPIEMPLGLWTRVGTRKHVLHGGAQSRYLANTSEPSMCGGDADLFLKLLWPLVRQLVESRRDTTLRFVFR